MTATSRTALVTGVAGQDGIYLARSLLRDGHRVVGTALPDSDSRARAGAYLEGVEIVPLDVCDAAGVRALVRRVEPDRVFNLAALSSVARSWQHPEESVAVNQTAVETLVAALLDLRAATGREVRLFQASSAEVTGAAASSPYAQAKAAAEEAVREARERHGLHACFARLHNHESPLRSPAFVTRKITLAAAEIACGKREELALGNLDVRRDWGFAGEYVDAIRRLLELDDPVDVPIGTGVAHSLAELLAVAFDAAGVGDPEPYVVQDRSLVRPADAAVTVADPEPAARVLGWRATTTFAQLVAHMVEVDLERVRTGVEQRTGYLWPSARA